MKKAVVLIDEWNISRASIQSGRLMNYTILKSTLEGVLEGDFNCDYVEFVIYVGLPPSREDFSDQRTSKNGFISMLESNGFLVKTRPGMPTTNGMFKANVDTMMCVDACSRFMDADIMLFVTGDGDFSYLVRHLRERLIPVGVACLTVAMSNDLKNACSFFVELDDIVNDLMQPVETASDLV